MSEEPRKPSEFSSLNEWSERFMEAATKSRPAVERPGFATQFRRRFAVPLAVLLALPTGAGIALAAADAGNEASGPGDTTAPLEVVDDGGPPTFELPVPGDIFGYVDLNTGAPIRCPDKSELQWTVPEEFGPEDGPICPDGSVPSTYLEQDRAWDEWVAAPGNPQPAVNGPNFQVLRESGAQRSAEEATDRPPGSLSIP